MSAARLTSVTDRIAKLTEQQRVELADRLRARRSRPQDGLPLSATQFGIWLFEQLQPNTSAYHNPVGLRLSGRLDVHALARALADVQLRQSTMRSRYFETEDGPRARVVADAALPLTVHDLRDSSTQIAEVKRLLDDATHQPFDLELGPVWRAVLIRTGEREHLLVLTLHHIISDGWSLRALAADLHAAYDARRHGITPIWRPLDPDFFALVPELERDARQARELLDAPLDRLQAMPKRIALPQDVYGAPTHVGSTVSALVNPATTAALTSVCRTHGATFNEGLLAAFVAVLAKASGQQRMVVAAPVSNRDRSSTHPLIGCFLNTVPLIVDLEQVVCFGDLVSNAQRAMRGGLALGHVPYGEIVAGVSRRLGQRIESLSNVMFVENNAPTSLCLGDELTVSRHPLTVTAVKHDWAVIAAPLADGSVGFELEYRCGLFGRPTMLAWARELEQACSLIADSPDMTASAWLRRPVTN